MSDHAELMTLRISHGLPLDAIGGDRSAKLLCTKRLEVPNVLASVIGVDVKVHAVLGDFRLRNWLEDEDWTRRLLVARGQDSIAIGTVDQAVCECRLPERNKGIGIAAVKNDRYAHMPTLRPDRCSCVERQQILFSFAPNQHAICSIG